MPTNPIISDKPPSTIECGPGTIAAAIPKLVEIAFKVSVSVHGSSPVTTSLTAITVSNPPIITPATPIPLPTVLLLLLLLLHP